MQKDLQAKQRHAASAAATAAGDGGASSSGRGAVNGSKGRVDHWLYEGIVVKVLSKALKEQGYYKQKVRVLDCMSGLRQLQTAICTLLACDTKGCISCVAHLGMILCVRVACSAYCMAYLPFSTCNVRCSLTESRA